jgi:hypothetical protein
MRRGFFFSRSTDDIVVLDGVTQHNNHEMLRGGLITSNEKQKAVCVASMSVKISENNRIKLFFAEPWTLLEYQLAAADPNFFCRCSGR